MRAEAYLTSSDAGGERPGRLRRTTIEIVIVPLSSDTPSQNGQGSFRFSLVMMLC